MDTTYDPNVPDCSNGGFFCKLCLARMNSQNMWTSHIVGKRHLKNAQKYPNGLPERFEGKDSYGREETNESYEYPSSTYDDYYDQNYYKKNPVEYIPVVKPNVVIDYDHSKKLDDIIPLEPKVPEVPSRASFSGTNQFSKVSSQEGKFPNVDDILDQIKSKFIQNGKGVPEKDNFFEKINQREIARDIASELSKSRFGRKDVKDNTSDKASLKSKESSKRKQDEMHKDEKRSKKYTATDIMDMIHKYNDDDLFKGSKIENSKDSSSKVSSTKLETKLNKIDPDKLTPDILDDLLSSRLTSKTNSKPKEVVKSFEKEAHEKKVNLDDPEVIAEKLCNLPNKTFFKIVQDNLKKIELKDSEELKMLLKIIGEAQLVVSKKLPAHVQLAVKAKMSENVYEKIKNDTPKTIVSQSHTVPSVTTQVPSTGVNESSPSTLVSQSYNVPLVSSVVQNATVSQNSNVPAVSSLVPNPTGNQNYPPVSTIPQFKNLLPVPSTIASSMSGTRAAFPPAQTFHGSFPVGVPPNPVAYQNFLQNYRANSAAIYYQILNAMYQNRQPMPTTNANTMPPQTSNLQLSAGVLPSTNASSVPSTLSSNPSNLQATTPVLNSPSRNLEAALRQLQKLSEEYKSKNESTEEPREKYREGSKDSTKDKDSRRSR